MDQLILDASVAISWCFPHDPTESTAYTQHVLDLLEEVDVLVPEIWPYEIANNIFVSFAIRKRINEVQLREYLELVESLPVRVEHTEWMSTIGLEALARKHNLAVYDIAYLELARRTKLPLATSDQALQKAALAEGIELVQLR